MIDLKQAPQKQINFFRDAFNNKKIAHAYLFVDPNQEQALATANWIACFYYCLGDNKPDGTCRNCQRILMRNHPDVFSIKPDGKKSISIDQVRPLKEELSKSPVEGTERFFFIQNSEQMTGFASNALLNLLEEPVAPVVTILIVDNENQILPTIRSRTQIIRFEDKKVVSPVSKLIEYGFSENDITELGNTDLLQQETKYLFQEILNKENMAFIRAHKLATNANSVTEKFVFYLLKQYSLKEMHDEKNQIQLAKLLQLLLDCDKMVASNVSFRSCLDYIILNY